MADSLCPFVYWGQKTDQISLKVDLRDTKVDTVDLTENSLKFEAEGVGSQGRNKYQFSLNFYLPVEPEGSRYKVTDRAVEFQIKKSGEGEVWPRLTEKQIKYQWLKIDFDKFATEDDSADEKEEFDPYDYDNMDPASQEEMMKKIEEQILAEGGPKAAKPDLKISYLFMYNLFQFVGYVYIVTILAYNFFKDGSVSKQRALELVGTQIIVCQATSFMEILHPLIGLVKTGVVSPLMQVLGRNFLLFVVLLQEPRLHDAPAVWYLFMTWSIIEIVRYPFYMLSSIGQEVKVITWLRYSAWIPLYPLGFLFEGTIIIMAVPLYADTTRLSLQLPNSANMAFYFPWFLQFYLVCMAFGAFKLLNHMYNQRKKRFYGTKPKHSKKSS